MRILLLALIFAIGLGGYSAAAHAFSADSCDVAMSMSASADHDTSITTPDTQHKETGGKCLDCAHCCMSHASAIPADYTLVLPELASDFHPLTVHVPVDDVFPSLLRPPKTLV